MEVSIETGQGRRAISVRHLNVFGPGSTLIVTNPLVKLTISDFVG